MSLYPFSRPCPKCGAKPKEFCRNTPAEPCVERWDTPMTEIDTDKLRALDEEPYLCAGCGRPFIAERSQCDCATGVGFRRSDHHQIVCEQAREVTISLDEHRVFLAMEEENKRLREALERCTQIVERNNHRQNEKVDDVVHIARRALGKEPKA